MPDEAHVPPESPAERQRELALSLYPYHLKYEARRDPRAIFAYVYFNITLDLAERLEDPQSDFEHPDWVADLARAFAENFMTAMDALDGWLEDHDASRQIETLYDAVPRPWADVYLATRQGQSYVLEDLVFSMMAHLSYDLPLALIKVPLDNDYLADYHLMNEILADRTAFIQSAVAKRYQRFLMWLDRLAGSYDEFLTNYGIRVSRSVAWYNALRLLSPTSNREATASIEGSAASFIRSVREPPSWWLRWAVRFFRAVIPRRRRWPAQPAEEIEASRSMLEPEIFQSSSRW